MVEVQAIKVEVTKVRLRELEWAQEVIRYLDTEELLIEKEEAKRIESRAARFTRIDRVLYQWGFSTPLLRCISPQEIQYALVEIHKGVCENPEENP